LRSKALSVLYPPPRLTYRNDCLGGEPPRFLDSCRLYLGGGGPDAPLSIALNPMDIGAAAGREFELNCRSVYGLAVTAAWFLYSRCRLSGVAAPGFDPALLLVHSANRTGG